ncbi:hypothetical protein Esti_006045 [Eimeria stiedai]
MGRVEQHPQSGGGALRSGAGGRRSPCGRGPTGLHGSNAGGPSGGPAAEGRFGISQNMVVCTHSLLLLLLQGGVRSRNTSRPQGDRRGPVPSTDARRDSGAGDKREAAAAAAAAAAAEAAAGDRPAQFRKDQQQQQQQQQQVGSRQGSCWVGGVLLSSAWPAYPRLCLCRGPCPASSVSVSEAFCPVSFRSQSVCRGSLLLCLLDPVSWLVSPPVPYCLSVPQSPPARITSGFAFVSVSVVLCLCLTRSLLSVNWSVCFPLSVYSCVCPSPCPCLFFSSSLAFVE